MTLTTTLNREPELLVTVEYTFTKGSRGHRDKYGAPEEPDDPDEIEVQSVTDAEGNEVNLTGAAAYFIEQQCWDDLAKHFRL